MLLQYVYVHPPLNPLPSREGKPLCSMSINITLNYCFNFIANESYFFKKFLMKLL